MKRKNHGAAGKIYLGLPSSPICAKSPPSDRCLKCNMNTPLSPLLAGQPGDVSQECRGAKPSQLGVSAQLSTEDIRATERAQRSSRTMRKLCQAHICPSPSFRRPGPMVTPSVMVGGRCHKGSGGEAIGYLTD